MTSELRNALKELLSELALVTVVSLPPDRRPESQPNAIGKFEDGHRVYPSPYGSGRSPLALPIEEVMV